jgi:hypothetical protein
MSINASLLTLSSTLSCMSVVALMLSCAAAGARRVLHSVFFTNNYHKAVHDTYTYCSTYWQQRQQQQQPIVQDHTATLR